MKNLEVYFEVSITKSFDGLGVIRKYQKCLLGSLLEQVGG